MGRKKKEITPAQMKKAEAYAYDGCKNFTIESLMNWPGNFINHRADISKRLTKKRQLASADLRKAQRNKAINDNDTTMQIWLGKNELDQSDQQKIKHDFEGNVVFNIHKTYDDKVNIPDNCDGGSDEPAAE